MANLPGHWKVSQKKETATNQCRVPQRTPSVLRFLVSPTRHQLIDLQFIWTTPPQQKEPPSNRFQSPLVVRVPPIVCATCRAEHERTISHPNGFVSDTSLAGQSNSCPTMPSSTAHTSRQLFIRQKFHDKPEALRPLSSEGQEETNLSRPNSWTFNTKRPTRSPPLSISHKPVTELLSPTSQSLSPHFEDLHLKEISAASQPRRRLHGPQQLMQPLIAHRNQHASSPPSRPPRPVGSKDRNDPEKTVPTVRPQTPPVGLNGHAFRRGPESRRGVAHRNMRSYRTGVGWTVHLDAWTVLVPSCSFALAGLRASVCGNDFGGFWDGSLVGLEW